MTIKEFSQLCGCNPQTLRFYDHEGLLKPANVDYWSGYRYYDAEQAISFVKIKNLQKAGFSIEEIRELLNKTDAEIYAAFDRKIAEEKEKLQEIINIQKSYQSNITDMAIKIEAAREKVRRSMAEFDAGKEFGISSDTYQKMLDNIDLLFANSTSCEALSHFTVQTDGEEDSTEECSLEDILKESNCAVVFEKHGWDAVKDFYDEIPALDDGCEYCFAYKVNEEKDNNIAFANTLLSMICSANPDKVLNLRCRVSGSDDGKNHFWLMRLTA